MLHNVITTSQVSTAACQIQAEMPQKTSLTFLKTFLPTLYFFQSCNFIFSVQYWHWPCPLSPAGRCSIYLLESKHTDAEQCDSSLRSWVKQPTWSACHTQMDGQWETWRRSGSQSQPLVLFLRIISETLSLPGGTPGAICSCPWWLGWTGSERGQEGEAAGGLFVCGQSPCCQTGREEMICE